MRSRSRSTKCSGTASRACSTCSASTRQSSSAGRGSRVADLSVFSASYQESRNKFLDAAGPRVKSYLHPREKGPAGEDLYLDVAWLGSPDAERVFAVGCGTHGIEGYPGSAALTHWLRSGAAKRLAPGTAVALLHAHNPWGFAHKTRVTEENVDLNRNFIDFSRPLPINRGYEDLHSVIAIRDWNEQAIAGAFAGLDAYREKVGEKAFSDAFNGGQYTRPDGIFYGGI